MIFSVIIPVYNVQRYLQRCVDSVLAQTYKDFEIILVDDGSTDGSGVLCDEIVKQDERIQVIHKSNGGLSDARNAGLRVATGEYVIFLDSDDLWLCSDGLQRIAESLEQYPTDVLLFKRVDLYPYQENTISVIDTHRSLSTDYDIAYIDTHTVEEVFLHLVRTQRFNMSACFLTIRRDLLVKNDIEFPLGLLSEDVDWSMRVWCHAQSVRALNLDMYGYWHRPGSISTTYSIRTLRSYDTMFTIWTQQINRLMGLYKNAVGGYLAGLYVSCLYQYAQCPKQNREEAKHILRMHQSLLRYAINPKARRAALVRKYAGFRFMLFIFSTYSSIKRKIKNH